jgi:hypothetical protein
MRISRMILTAGAMMFAGLVLAGEQAAAQDFQNRNMARRRAPLRIEVTPRRVYRQCADSHVIEHRASGDTVVPRTRCWWATQ